MLLFLLLGKGIFGQNADQSTCFPMAEFLPPRGCGARWQPQDELHLYSIPLAVESSSLRALRIWAHPILCPLNQLPGFRARQVGLEDLGD